LVEGSGGTAGWPQPGCRCASCLRQAAAGNARMPSTIVVDGQLRIGSGHGSTSPEMGKSPKVERHETGNPVRSNAVKPGVHAVAGGAGQGGYRVRWVPDLRDGAAGDGRAGDGRAWDGRGGSAGG